jgi:hypothetical protein
LNSASKHLRVQLQTDEKHVQDDAELGDNSEKRGDSRWKNKKVGCGRNIAEQRWTQQDAPDNFSDDRRLTDDAEDPPEKPAHDDHRCHCQ